MAENYAKMNQILPKQRTALARAIKSQDQDTIIYTVRKTVREWNEIGFWPDQWSDWQRALDDNLGWKRHINIEDLV